MIRGTTPKHLFSELPFAADDVKQIWITYFQNGKDVLTKDITSVELTDDPESETSTAAVQLSQQDTLLFTGGSATIQLRVLLNDDTALASNEVVIDVGRIIKNGPIE